MSGPATVRIYNPLPRVLQHFVRRLANVLESADVSTIHLRSADGEVGRNFAAKAMALGEHVRLARRSVKAGAPNIVAWPLLGWWEMPLWRHPKHGTLVIMHDPEPLAKQNGLSPWAATTSARLSGLGWPHMVTMSPEAHAVATKYFDSEIVHQAPHPMIIPTMISESAPDRIALVLGQYKPTRDLELMTAMADCAKKAGWVLVVAGRGWPDIPGWVVVNNFLTEAEFCHLLSAARAVIVPYRNYFQSGVAIRALETGIPVVGRSSGFLNSILGDQFPGTVGDGDCPDSWVHALNAAASGREHQLQAANRYAVQGVEIWRDLVDLTSSE